MGFVDVALPAEPRNLARPPRVIPALGNAVETRLLELLASPVTSLSPADLASLPFSILAAADPDVAALGIHATGSPDLAIVLTDPARPVGHIAIDVKSPGCVLFLDNRAATGNLQANIRMLGPGCAALFHGLSDGYIALEELFMRSADQLLFWGPGATAVGLSIEMEGDGRLVAIGDDALISSGIWIRNHDMHAVHDLRTDAQINRAPVDTLLERHVWIGQNALLLGCQRIGIGSIVGAMSLLKGEVGACVAVGGVPARVIRYQVSWGRAASGMTAAERALLGPVYTAARAQPVT